jgi:hypothetical protein
MGVVYFLKSNILFIGGSGCIKEQSFSTPAITNLLDPGHGSFIGYQVWR